MNKARLRHLVASLEGYDKKSALLNMLSTEHVDTRQQALPRHAVDIVPLPKAEDAETIVACEGMILSGRPIKPIPVAIYMLLGQAFCVWPEKPATERLTVGGLPACLYEAAKRIAKRGGELRRLPVEVVARTVCQPQGVTVSGNTVTGYGKEWKGVSQDVIDVILKFPGVN